MVEVPSRRWTKDELLIAFNYYCRIPFGQLHHTNPEIIKLAEFLGRTPSAVSMKLCNFASLDPSHRARNVKGLSHASREDVKIWEEFNDNWENLAFVSQEAVQRIDQTPRETFKKEITLRTGVEDTEKERFVRVRTVQKFFRETVLASYQGKCAVCSLSIPEMLSAGHIIPWSVNVERRADPTNGLALCSFHDRAFDRGLITVDESMRIVVASELIVPKPSKLHQIGLIDISGQTLILPQRFSPDPKALEYHRQNIFQGN